MAESPVLGPTELHQLTYRMERLEIATLAAALIVAAGRPHSVQETLNLVRDLEFAARPNPGSGTYQQWKQTSDLNKAHT